MEIEFINNRYYIVFSEYDDDHSGAGWYLQDTKIKGWPVSQLFETKAKMIEGLRDNKINWDK